MMKGIITEVQGPVVDVLFPEGQLPFIKDALTVQNGEQKCVMEVAQHMGGNIVRCIMLSPSEGLCREMEVTAEGGGIQVPVGDRTLGRLFNVTGEIIDGGEPLPEGEKWCIHRDPPGFADQSPVVEILETGIKVIDLLAPYAKGGKIGLYRRGRALPRGQRPVDRDGRKRGAEKDRAGLWPDERAARGQNESGPDRTDHGGVLPRCGAPGCAAVH